MIFVEAEVTVALAGLHQLGWCIMMLKINKHLSCSEGVPLDEAETWTFTMH